MNFDLAWLECLDAVVREGSFEAAARALHVTQSAVSQRIRQLETRAGQPLLLRTRPPRPTPAAQPLLRFVRQVRALAVDAWPAAPDAIAPEAERIAIGVNADSLATWVLPALAPWAARTGRLIEFVVDDQDHTAELLRRGEVIGSIGAAGRPLQGCRSLPLGSMAYRCVATRAFKARHFAQGFSAAAARRAPAVVFDRKDDMHQDLLEQAFGARALPYPHHFVPSSEGCVEAILAGYGYGMLPEPQCAPLLARGRLVELAPRHRIAVTLYWHSWAIESSLVRGLTEAVVEGAAEALGPPQRPASRPRRGSKASSRAMER